MSHNNSKYKVNKPYPIVNIESNNSFYASLLLDDYAGFDSEFTAISQYVYGHILSQDTKVSNIFLGIGIVEMEHLDLLGDVILDLGENPKFKDGHGHYWKGDFVPYGCSTKDRISLAIEAETSAIKQYREHIRLIKNPDIIALLERIILDEQLHLNIFKSLL